MRVETSFDSVSECTLALSLAMFGLSHTLHESTRRVDRVMRPGSVLERPGGEADRRAARLDRRLSWADKVDSRPLSRVSRGQRTRFSAEHEVSMTMKSVFVCSTSATHGLTNASESSTHESHGDTGCSSQLDIRDS